jgi:hypothetical protein
VNATGVETSLPPRPRRNTDCPGALFLNSDFIISPPLQRYDPLRDPAWDEVLATCSNPSFFYSTAWARVLHDSYGYQPHYFVDRQSTPFAFPWMGIRSWLTGSRGVSLPFTDACATKGISPPAFHRSLQHITRLSTQLHWKYWEFRGGADILTDIVPSTMFLNHQLKLESCDAHMFARFQSTTRTAVRNSEAAGVHVEITRDIAALKIFYELLCQTRRRHGTPPQPFAFFAELHRHVLQQDRGFIALARKNAQPAAGIFFLRYGPTAIYKYAASDERLQQFRASNLVLWRGIQHLIQSGVSLLDFGRTSITNTGLQRFKLAWGSEEYHLGYLRFNCHTQCYTMVSDRSSGWQTRLFRITPLLIGKLIGRVLYRHSA